MNPRTAAFETMSKSGSPMFRWFSSESALPYLPTYHLELRSVPRLHIVQLKPERKPAQNQELLKIWSRSLTNNAVAAGEIRGPP